ncbi:MAG: hypothetical protein HOP29_00025 [Phycisphaerales bacterium]|nr:hypothetical protein [Phycisphaerales bacterium]
MFHQRLVPVVVAVTAAAWLVSCTATERRGLVRTEKLEPYECGSVQRLHTMNGVFLASQPQREDFQHAKDGGIKTIVNLRPHGELDWDEQAYVEGLGMEYQHIPFKSPEELTDDVFDRSRELLNDADRRPLMMHCSSANRVGAVWLAHRVLDGGLPYEEALREAETVGLKLPAYAERARAYIDGKRN